MRNSRDRTFEMSATRSSRFFFFFARFQRKDSAVHGRWKPKRRGTRVRRRRAGRQKQTRVSGTSHCPIKQHSRRPTRLNRSREREKLTIFFFASIPNFIPEIKDPRVLYARMRINLCENFLEVN